MFQFAIKLFFHEALFSLLKNLPSFFSEIGFLEVKSWESGLKEFFSSNQKVIFDWTMCIAFYFKEEIYFRKIQ